MQSVIGVTGGARGIGRGIVLRLLQDGHDVAVLDEDAHGLSDLQASVQSTSLLTLRCDVASPSQVGSAFDQIRDWRGRLDGWVNNAGIAQAVQEPPEVLDYERWRRVLSVNLDGSFLCSRAAAAAFAAGGAIVNIASTRALQSEANSEAYAASKGGLLALTHALAVSLGPRVRVNAVSPGWIDTTASVPGASAAPLRSEDHAQHPAGRVGQVEDVAEMVVFLLSARAGFITGQNFVVDGGMTRKMIYIE